MKAQLTQEAKDALLASIEERILKLENDRTPNYGSVRFGITECVEAIKSFPTSSNEGISVSDGGKPNPTDNWIPVSERVPDTHTFVWLFNGGCVTGGVRIVDDWYVDDGQMDLNQVTHWMEKEYPNQPNKRSE